MVFSLILSISVAMSKLLESVLRLPMDSAKLVSCFKASPFPYDHIRTHSGPTGGVHPLFGVKIFGGFLCDSINNN
jgi:hypothetical protein